MPAKLIGIAVAGAFGTLARYSLSSLVATYAGGAGFPWGTLVVNALGCFGFGFIATMAAGRLGLSAEMKVFVLTGFLGAFTTFSTLHFETHELFRGARWLTAAGNLVGQNLLGVGMLVAGAAVGRLL